VLPEGAVKGELNMRPQHLLPALALFALGAPAAAEVATVSDAGFVIRHEVETPASKNDAWRALVAPGKWWSSAHTYSGNAANMFLDAQGTGCFCETLPKPADAPEGQRMGSVEHMHVVYADPPQGVLRMKGGLGPLQGESVIGTLTITVRPTPQGSKITWEYVVGGYIRMKNEDIAPAVDKVLGEQLGRLAAFLTPPVAEAADPAPAKPD
jgi:hypothetical protein